MQPALGRKGPSVTSSLGSRCPWSYAWSCVWSDRQYRSRHGPRAGAGIAASEEAPGMGSVSAGEARFRKLEGLAREFRLQQPQRVLIVDVVPLRYIHDRELDLARAVEREAVDLRRAPGD